MLAVKELRDGLVRILTVQSTMCGDPIDTEAIGLVDSLIVAVGTAAENNILEAMRSRAGSWMLDSPYQVVRQYIEMLRSVDALTTPALHDPTADEKIARLAEIVRPLDEEPVEVITRAGSAPEENPGMTVEEKLIKLSKMFPNKHVALIYKEGDNNYDIYLGDKDYPFRRGFSATEALDKMLTLEPDMGEDCAFFVPAKEKPAMDKLSAEELVDLLCDTSGIEYCRLVHRLYEAAIAKGAEQAGETAVGTIAIKCPKNGCPSIDRLTLRHEECPYDWNEYVLLPVFGSPIQSKKEWEIQMLRSDIHALEGLLADLPADHVIERLGFESQKQEDEERLAVLAPKVQS